MITSSNQHKQQIASVWLRFMLILIAMLFTVKDATAQLQLNESTAVLSGLPTIEEIEATKVNEAVKQIVMQLDSYSFVQRELASQRLISNSIDRRQICKVLSSEDLSLEQRHRLVDCLRYDLLTAPHAAIGISIDFRRVREVIVIDALIENLPAIEVLKPGDQIVGLDGFPITKWEQFLQSISTRKPGDKVTITIKRRLNLNERNNNQEPQMRKLDFEIILGSDEYLLNYDGTRQVSSYVQGALNKDLKTIVERYGPKILRIEGDEPTNTEFNLGTTAVKKN